MASPGGTAATLLFTRLPERLFAPLAAPNKPVYWALLCHLYAMRFGPDAPLPPSQGFATRDIILDIEEQLVIHDAWEAEEDTTPETPLNIRANAIFNRLQDCGWLRLDRYGVEKRVSMTPAVSQFLGQLINFAETGPVFVAGKVRSIKANLEMVINGSGEGDSLSEAADQARHLLEHIRNTGTNIRDLMSALSETEGTAEFVRSFFSDYVERKFIGDYQELRTREHPLSQRPQIIRWAEELLATPQSREHLISWYETKRYQGDRSRAERMFERDVQKLLDMSKIDDYLERLDDEIRRANRKALAHLDYRLRSLRPLDGVIDAAITRITGTTAEEIDVPFADGELISPMRLAEPRRATPREAASSLREAKPTAEDLALLRLKALARDARMVTTPKLVAFVSRQLAGKEVVASEDLVIESIADIRAYQTLLMLGAAVESGSMRLQLAVRPWLRGFRIRRTDKVAAPGSWVSGAPFVIERTRQHTANKESGS